MMCVRWVHERELVESFQHALVDPRVARMGPSVRDHNRMGARWVHRVLWGPTSAWRLDSNASLSWTPTRPS